MLYSLVAALLVFLSILLPPMFATESTDKTGLVVYFYASLLIFFCALSFDLAAFFARYPTRYFLIVVLFSYLSVPLIALFAPKPFFDSGFYPLFIFIVISVLYVALATLFYKLIQLLIKLLR